MLLKYKLPLTFSILSLVIIVTTAVFYMDHITSVMINADREKMVEKLATKKLEIANFHYHASEELLKDVLQNPLFIKYFELPETKAGNVYEDGVLQFTEKQLEIKNKLEQTIYTIQSNFEIDEACLIDTSGQEHLSLVLKKIKPSESLSHDEEEMPFFKPSFEKEKNQVHAQYPYISPDTNRAVFGYASPIVLDSGEKPAIYHFEIPLTIFQDLLKTDHGRFIVVDPQGFVIAEPNYNFLTENISEKVTEETSEEESMSEDEISEEEMTVTDEETTDKEHSDHLHVTEFPSSDRFLDFIEEFKTQESGTFSYEYDGEIYYTVYTKLSTFGWILIFEEPKSLIVSENKESVEKLAVTIATFSTIVSIGAIFTTFYISKRFTRPLSKLIDTANEISKGKFDSKIKVVGKDEISELTSTFNKMTESLKESEKQKDEFSSMVSHELKTPLTPLMAYSEMLKNKTLGPLNKDQQTAATAISSASMRLENLISELLDAKKLALGKLDIHKKEFLPSELINKLVLDIDPLVKSKGISVITSSAKTRSYSDPDRIYQVLTNLATNAIKAVPEKTGKIEIALKDEEKNILFYIKDNGIGIPKEKQSKLFTKFYQVDTSLTRKFGGTGLGLTICKGIVEKLGGKIWAESDEGMGATFYFTIPKE